MIIRYLSSAPVGIVVTTALFYVMQILIQLSPGQAPVAIERIPVNFVRDIRNEEIIVDKWLPPVIPPAALTPETDRTNSDPDNIEFIGVGKSVTAPFESLSPSINFGYSDGTLVNIIKVAPIYPVRALQQNLEGYATVRFDVTELGTIENVVVIDASHSIFHKAAIAAAYRFRYKPRVVDGVAQSTRGLVNRFVFRIEE